jgi:L-asparaginase
MGRASDGRTVVALLALGGTIAMTREPGSDGVTPGLDAEALASSVSGLTSVADLRARTLSARPSASLSVDDLLMAADAAREAVDSGARGVVITQGTDTMEETAFLLDLVWDRPEPLVVTGAMRNPTQPGADGPSNVLAAVTAAAATACGGRGCLVVMNEQIHAARFVQKRHSSSPSAFESPQAGPVGVIREGSVLMFHPPRPRAAMPISQPLKQARVALVEATLDDDGELLVQCAAGDYDGIVIAAFGVGHLSETAAARAIKAAAVKPVVLSTRAGAGGVFSRTYGFLGSESHLLRAGLISAGMLTPRQARILLLILLRSGADRAAIARAFSLNEDGPAAPDADASDLPADPSTAR